MDTGLIGRPGAPRGGVPITGLCFSRSPTVMAFGGIVAGSEVIGAAKEYQEKICDRILTLY